MKQMFATLALATGVSLTSHAHSGSAGHDGSVGLVPHLHMGLDEALIFLAATGLGLALWKGLKFWSTRHGSR